MPKTQKIRVSKADLPFAKALIKADHGTITNEQPDNGTVTLTVTFPDPVTSAALVNPSGVAASSGGEPPWMAIARGELGTKEAPAGKNNPRILEYFASCVGGPQPDSVPWCSAFVNFCVTQAGLKGTNSLAARSWAKWGKDAGALTPGCIVVLWRGTPTSTQGHVGFFVEQKGDKVFLLGGNQSDEVNIRSHDLSRVIAKRTA